MRIGYFFFHVPAAGRGRSCILVLRSSDERRSNLLFNGTLTNRFVRSTKIVKVVSWNKREMKDGTWISSMGKKKFLPSYFVNSSRGKTTCAEGPLSLFPSSGYWTSVEMLLASFTITFISKEKKRSKTLKKWHWAISNSQNWLARPVQSSGEFQY